MDPHFCDGDSVLNCVDSARLGRNHLVLRSFAALRVTTFLTNGEEQRPVAYDSGRVVQG